MNIEKTDIKDVVIITPTKFHDARGYFMESYKHDWFVKNVAPVDFVQDNQSFSANESTIRGLHYQKAPFGQGKLIRVLAGAIFDVAVDIRENSDTFGKWVGVELTAENAKQLWIPDGFAHGFCTLTANCLVAYKVTQIYSRDHDCGLAFNDNEIGIEWPIDISRAILSQKDMAQPNLSSLR